MLRDNDVIFLLGAGCSYAAKIPTSDIMLTEVHDLLRNKAEWKKFHALYCHLRGLILQADALQGRFTDSFNIERLVASLGEIESRNQNFLFPFVQSLHPDLVEIAGKDMQLVSEFRRIIVERLKAWVQIPDYDTAKYYRHFFDFASDYNQALRIFTLNYDLCLERNTPPLKVAERGFDKSHKWDWRRFDTDDNEAPTLYYYKMHGSIDWERDKNHGNIIKEVQNTPDEPDLIFGAINKLYAIDPYLFFAFEFRKYSLLAKIILVMGYSFSDDHINRIIKQAVENNSDRKIVVVMPYPNVKDICRRLGLPESSQSQIICLNKKAEEYLATLSVKSLTLESGTKADDPPDPFSVN